MILHLTSRKGVVVVLAAIWFAILLSNTLFLMADGGQPRGVDCAEHLNMTYQIVAGARLHGAPAVWQDLVAFDVKWPTLVHLLYGVLGATVDHSLRAMRLYDMLFMAVLLVGMYWLGQLCHSRAAGLLAAACCALAPNIIGFSRHFGLDFPGAAMVTVAMAALLATRRFSVWSFSVLFGLLAGLATLTKGQSLLFLAPPALGVLGLALWRRERRALWRCAAAVAVGFAVSAVWWATRLEQLVEIFLSHLDASDLAREGDQSLLGGVRMYVLGLPWLVSPPLMVGLLLFGLPAMRRPWSNRLPLALWFLVPLALHVVLAVRNYRYVLALIPAVALAVAVGVMSIKSGRTRRWAAGALVGTSVALWLLCGSAALRRPAWACSPLFCGETYLSQVSHNGPLATVAERVAPVLAGERRAGREVYLLATLDPDAVARSADLGDIANHLRAMLPEVAWVFQDSVLTPWRAHPRGPHARYLLAAGEELPAGFRGNRVLTVNTLPRTPSGHLDCTVRQMTPPAVSSVSLWKLKADTREIRFPERR